MLNYHSLATSLQRSTKNLIFTKLSRLNLPNYFYFIIFIQFLDINENTMKLIRIRCVGYTLFSLVNNGFAIFSPIPFRNRKASQFFPVYFFMGSSLLPRQHSPSCAFCSATKNVITYTVRRYTKKKKKEKSEKLTRGCSSAASAACIAN